MSGKNVRSSSTSSVNDTRWGPSSLRLLAPVPFISSSVTTPLRSWCSVKFGDQKPSSKCVTQARSIEHDTKQLPTEKGVISFFQRRTGRSKKPLQTPHRSPNQIPLAVVAPFEKVSSPAQTDVVPCQDKRLAGGVSPLPADRAANKQTELGHRDGTTSSPQCQQRPEPARETGESAVDITANVRSSSANEKLPSKTCSASRAHQRLTLAAVKTDNWFKDRDNGAAKKDNNVPVWARDTTSPLHSQIQRVRCLYDELAKPQTEKSQQKKQSAPARPAVNAPNDSVVRNDKPASTAVHQVAAVCKDASKPSDQKVTFEGQPNYRRQVMENGGYGTTSPLRSPQSPTNNFPQIINDKSQSLPGFYKPPSQVHLRHEQSHVANVPQQKLSPNTQNSPKEKPLEDTSVKSYKHILGNWFHRKKKDAKEETSSLSEKECENIHENNSGYNRGNVVERKTLQNSHYDNIIMPPSVNSTTFNHQYQSRNMYYPTHHLNRVFSHEELPRNSLRNSAKNKHNLIGVPSLTGQRKLVPSISYDSLPASGFSMNSESAYGSINSVRSQSTGKGERSPSTDTFTRRERREAIMAKVKKIRDKQVNSSSDEDQASHSSLPESESSLKINLPNGKTKSSRTERHFRRKSQECLNLRHETEKDKRSKAIVQARILEIQHIKEQESQRTSSHIIKTETIPEKPRWSASLVYQESNQFDSVIIPPPIKNQSLSKSKYTSSNVGPKNLQHFKSNSLDHNKISHGNFPHENSSIAFNEINSSRKPKFEISAILKSGVTPPEPPPRDPGRFLSPRELHRPFSYSFENINHIELAHSQPIDNVPTKFLPSPTSSNNRNLPVIHLSNGCKRAFSEQKLNQLPSPVSDRRTHIHTGIATSFNYARTTKPQRALLTLIPAKDPKLSLLNLHEKSTSQTNVSDCNRSFEDNRRNIHISSMPPSPSSDYASYISENSSMVTNLSSPRLMSRQEFREIVTENSLEIPHADKFAITSSPMQEKPKPPKRDFSSLNKGNKECSKQSLMQAAVSATTLSEEKDKLNESYQQEKEQIIKSKCSNLEQSIKELEDIYNDLDLNNEDMLDMAERRDLPTEHQLMWAKNRDNSKSSSFEQQSPIHTRQNAPKLRRSRTPDKVTDDVHYRRCIQAKPKSLKNKQDLPSASYMLFSPVHSPTLDTEEPYIQNDKTRKEPNITSDDVTYRNVQRANAIKIIDPQPPFGIPIGPLTQGSSTDYLHLQAKETYKPILSTLKYPDVVMDDMAFRNLRKDNSSSEKQLNWSELDGILSETETISKPRHNLRSISLDRINHNHFSSPTHKRVRSNVPRHLRNVKKKVSKNKFYDGYKGALTDSEGTATRNRTPTDRDCGCVVKKTEDNNIDSSTETITEKCNLHNSNPGIRSDIIKESMFPAGAPSLVVGDDDDNPFLDTSRFYPSISTLEDSCAERKARAQDSASTVAVDLTKLNDLISTINTSDTSTESEPDHRSTSAVRTSDSLKPFVIRANDANLELRKGTAAALLDPASIAGNESNRRHSSIGVSSSECCSSNVTDTSFLAVANSRIPGPSKPERIFLTDPISLKLVIESQLEAISLTAKNASAGTKDVGRKSTPALNEIQKITNGNIPTSIMSTVNNSDSSKICAENQNRNKHHFSNAKCEHSSHAKLHSPSTPMVDEPQRVGHGLTGEREPGTKPSDGTSLDPERRTKRDDTIFPKRMCQGGSKEEAESLAKRLHCKEPSSKIKTASRAKELEKRNRRLEYEKQRVASLKKVSPDKEKSSKSADKSSKVVDKLESKSTREVSKRRSEYIQSGSSGDRKPAKLERTSPDGESDRFKSQKAAENESKVLSENLHVKMVQGSNHVSTAPIPQPRTTVNANSVDNGGSDRSSDADRRERIQRYKEERRKQMAARYGTSADLSSSDEEKRTDNAASSTARRRKRGKPGTESSSANVSTTENKRIFKIKDRQQRNTSQEELSKNSFKLSDSNFKSRKSSLNNNERVEHADDSVYQVKRRVLDAVSQQNVVLDSPEAGSSGGGTVGDSKVHRRRNSGSSKDKSHKRKSNLNRAPSEEPTPDADDTIRRRRRRSDNILSTYSPELTSVQLVANVSSSGSCHSVSAPRMSEGSSGGGGGDLKPRKRLSYQGDSHSMPLTRVVGDPKTALSSRHSLKKPEIPETLRAKETGRSQSRIGQGQEKPPVVPEIASKSPSAVLASVKSQRKSQDYGACFMANKREKDNATNSLRNGGQSLSTERSSDRTSESDAAGKETMNDHIDHLTAQAKSLIARVEHMANVPGDPIAAKEDISSLQQADEGCLRYGDSTSFQRRLADCSSVSREPRERINGCDEFRSAKRPEGIASKRLAFRDAASAEEVSVSGHLSTGIPAQSVSFEDDPSNRRSRKDCIANVDPRAEHFAQKGSRGSSVDSESPRVNSPEPHSILKRKSSREEQWASFDRSMTPEPQSILKKKSTSRTSSSDNLDCDPRPILKKKNSVEDLEQQGEQLPKPILKKKSLTDDELELAFALPRSILKGARSREDLPRADGAISPASILKRFSKGELDYEGGDLKPILKRRQTTDGVRRSVNNSESENESPYRLRSDSAPEAVALLSRSPPSHRVTPRHGILKNSRNSRCSATADDIEVSLLLRSRRSVPPDEAASVDNIAFDTEPNRPVSPSLSLLTARKSGPERPLSVAERIAGMEALQLPSAADAGAAASSRGDISPQGAGFTERASATADVDEPASYLPAASLHSNQQSSDGENFRMPSRVSQRAAFFAQLERNGVNEPKTPEDTSRKGRGARFATQPVTDTEVNEATRRVDSPNDATASERYGSLDNIQKQSLHVRVANEDVQCEASVGARVALWSRRLHQLKLEASSPPRRTRGGRYKTQPVTLDEVSRAHAFKGTPGDTLGTAVQNGKDSKDAPRSILKSDFIRRLSNDDHLKGILKSDSPSSSVVTSPENETRPLRSVLKKDSSVEDKEIKSILKRQSESLEPDASSDSSSDLMITEPVPPAVPEVLPGRSMKSFMVQDDWAEALRNMGPSRAHESPRNTDSCCVKLPAEPIEEMADARSFEDELLNERTAFEEEALIFGDSNPWELEGLSRLRGINAAPITEAINAAPITEAINAAPITEATNSQLVCDRRETSFQAANSSFSSRMMTVEKNSSFRSTSYDNRQLLVSSDSDSDQENRLGRQNKAKSQTYESRVAELQSASHHQRLAVEEDRTDTSLLLKEEVHVQSQRFESINAELRTGWQSMVQKGSQDGANLEAPIQAPRKPRPNSLMERVTQLETSSQQWKNRVEQSDATRFTVAHRMTTSSSTTSVPNALLKGVGVGPQPRSPSVERVRRTPQPRVFKSKTGGNIPDLMGSVRKELFARSHSQPGDSHEEAIGAVVSVPNPDDDAFNAFFSSSSTTKVDQIDVDIGSFDHVTRNASKLLATRRNVRVTRRQQSTGNPLRTLARRLDLKSEYTEVKLGVGDRELKRMKVEEIAKGSTFAMEALAGLASKENFNAISLKKVDGEKPVARDMPTYLDLMLLQVKGRRRPQVKLVAPRSDTVNAGDDFILITPAEVLHYKGEFANVIERAVCSEVVSYILQTKDMGVSQECRVAEINAHSATNAHASFWRHLGGNTSSKPTDAGLPEDDDLFETAIVSSNKVYEVVGNSLVPIKEAWGQSPKYQLLSSDKVLVFDFGSEVYLWTGKFACPDVRKDGAALLKELWQEQYDYSDCDINPVTMTLKNDSAPMKGNRPDWGICGKITENVETILFKEKFDDWPDTAQQSRRMEVEKELLNKPEPVSEVSPCDVTQMIDNTPSPPDLVLEMSHLGRGVEYYDEEERRLLCISTNDVKVWHISENEKNFVDEKSFGHFYAGETYVVRWYYNVTSTGRTLKGTPSKHNMTGRIRVAYFFWQGSGSSVSDKGVSALMTVELDEERGPHIRVPMCSEPPAFLNLFNGGLVYHAGKANVCTPRRRRMYLVRGNRECEAHLLEVGSVSATHLRSRACVVLTDAAKGIAYLWSGAKALRHTRKIASHAISRLARSAAPEIRWSSVPATISQQSEGQESADFLAFFDHLPLSSAYYSLLGRGDLATSSSPVAAMECTPRFWKFDATRGNFEAIEITSTYRCTVVTPFPIVQDELYASIQPGLFLIDSGDKVWVWQGWWPDGRSCPDISRAATGSAQLRFTFARRAAFQTALNYVREKTRWNLANKESVNMEPRLVIAGMEPLEFCNLFPIWVDNPDIQQLQEKEGRYTAGKQYSVRETLQELSKTRYTLEELLQYPRPDGIDQLHLENYLSSEDFIRAIGMDRHTFRALPEWKQVDIKKKANLF